MTSRQAAKLRFWIVCVVSIATAADGSGAPASSLAGAADDAGARTNSARIRESYVSCLPEQRQCRPARSFLVGSDDGMQQDRSPGLNRAAEFNPNGFHYLEGMLYCLDLQFDDKRCVYNGVDTLICHRVSGKMTPLLCYQWESWVAKWCQIRTYNGRIYGNADGLELSNIPRVNEAHYRCLITKSPPQNNK